MRKLLFVLILTLSGNVVARDFPHHGSAVAFDYYTLSLSLAPAFCEENPGRARHLRQCNGLTQAGFQSRPLTLHGLWPSRFGRRHPAWCGSERQEGGGFCRMDRTPVSRLTYSQLAAVMPGVSDCLDRYEWGKHGTCSGLGADAYFGRAIDLVERANRALRGRIAASTGTTIPLAQLRARLSQVDPQLTEATVFDCQSPRGGGRPMLTEIRMYFAKDPATGGPGRPMPFRFAGVRSYNSGCPAGRAYIDRP
jgi:ribonuclease T2